MIAHHFSARLAPKKANLVARMVRGLPVPDAVELLRRTNKKGARIIEAVLRSAMANASQNFKQDPQTMVLKTIVVNQGTAYQRGIPMARGRVRPIQKFLCHVSVTLGYPEEKRRKGTEGTKGTDGTEVVRKKNSKKISAKNTSAPSVPSKKQSSPTPR